MNSTSTTQTMQKHVGMMTLALGFAREALAIGEFPVGCVISVGAEIVATGQRTNSQGAVNEIDHAEIIALRKLLLCKNMHNMNDVTVYSTLEPCLMCYATLLVNGVRNIVYAYEDAMGGGTKLDLERLPPLYREMQVNIISNVLRSESLQLFKTFFSQGRDRYLANTYLARYTMAQKLLQ